MTKDPFTELVAYYFTTLAGANIAMYDEMVDEDGPDKYVVMREKTTADVPGKSTNIGECTLLLDVVCKSADTGGKSSRALANTILGLINRDTPITLTSFEVCTTTLRSTNTMSFLSGTNKVFRVLLRLSHIVSEK
jgi:hypothetical protein